MKLIVFRKAKRKAPLRKIKKSAEAQTALNQISQFLDENAPELAMLFVTLWSDQQRVTTYNELYSAAVNGYIDEGTLMAWQRDYTRFLNINIVPSWAKAIETAAEHTAEGFKFNSTFVFDPMAEGITIWVREYGAKWVTNITTDARDAINAIIYRAITDGWAADELAQTIRPAIGLTTPQAGAYFNYYRHVRNSILENNPAIKEATAAQRARTAAERYAARQRRRRAFTIAQTELAFAYNRGADFAVKQAIKQGLMGRTVRVWSTAASEGVCSICGALDGTTVGMDEEFSFKGKSLFPGQKQTPPAHPNCRCAVEYREVEPPGGTPTQTM